METKKEMEARDNCDQSGNEKLVPVYEFRMQKTMGENQQRRPRKSQVITRLAAHSQKLVRVNFA